ncbi:MAG: DUF1697 domain-containing protein [Myxococcaceae bacterium]|nr:DUF1697 domain-containing protein [Myxococcaceae bacterium]
MPSSTTRSVAFFRNVNLGRPPCPSKVELERAFFDAGAEVAFSFLTNGTVVFDARSPERVLELARARLAARGLREPAFLRTLRALRRLVARDPFSAVNRADVHECSVTLLDVAARFPRSAPRVTPRRDVEVLGFTRSEVFSLSRVVGRSPGSPNAFLEKLLGLPATTRNWNTVVRVVKKFG